MGSRWKNLFSGSSSTSKSLKGGAGSYDSAVALEPPVKGSYPVAGNGPNVLEEIQRSRARKESSRQQSIAASHRQSFISSTFTPGNNSPRQHHEDPIERPRTAPHNGPPRRDFSSTAEPVGGHERTRSGFSMKSPPSFFSNRRKSTYSTHSFVPVAPPPPPLPKETSRVVQAYIPKTGPSYVPSPPLNPTSPRSPAPLENQLQQSSAFVPPFAQHQRSSSRASHRSHVDLLDAYSNIRSGAETSQTRAKASGVRNYGEDVADRNIADFGEKDPLKLDLNSPDFGYMKSIYAVKKQPGRGGDAHSRAGSALGHIHGYGDGLGDDTIPRTFSGQATSIRSFNTTGPRPGMTYPARGDSSPITGYGRNNGRDEPDFSIPVGTPDSRGRAMSPLSVAFHDDPPPRDPRRQNADYIRAGSVPSRGRAIASSNNQPLPSTSQRAPSAGQERLRISSPVRAPPSVTSPIHSRNSSATGQGKQRQRTTSSASQTNGSTKSRSGSVSYSAFPTISRRESLAQESANESIPRSMANSGNRRTGSSSDVARELAGLYGTTGSATSADADVTTKRNTAVVQEHVQPISHDMRNEIVTRDIHNHDNYHRVLPVVDTETLPTKHYVHASDGTSLVEIPESQVSDHLYYNASNRRHESEDRRYPTPVHHRRDSSTTNSLYPQQDIIYEETGADAPVIPLARRDPNYDPKYGRSRGDSRSSVKSTKSKSGSRTRNIIEPFLSGKKESTTTTRDGISSAEYDWRHSPTAVNSGSSQPAVAGPGLHEISGFDYSDDEDIEGKEFGAMREDFDLDGRRRHKSTFTNLEYRGPGALPGLNGPEVPSSRTLRREDRHVDGVPGRDRFEEATMAMRRLAERQRGAGAGGGEWANRV